jgi:hypothetical protein
MHTDISTVSCSMDTGLNLWLVGATTVSAHENPHVAEVFLLSLIRVSKHKVLPNCISKETVQ